MLRLDIEYDFLPRESEILHLKFWEAAFEKLKQTGVLYFENEGKNKGCWVMTRAGAPQTSPRRTAEGTDEDAKVIVRSNGTVTYVGKDIAYHLWKFGLLGRDFGYKPFFTYPDHECWISAEHGEANHPHFGGATAIYNVIDARQSDPQANVIQALRGMGYTEQADHYTHFSYEMVALTPRCAVELGYSVSDEDKKKPYIEVSGRKGFGVKADDLIDKLIAAAQPKWTTKQAASPDAGAPARSPVRSPSARCATSCSSTRATPSSPSTSKTRSASKAKPAPTFNTPSCAFATSSAKADTTPEAVLAEFAKHRAAAARLRRLSLSGEENEDIWALWLRAGRFSLVLEQCIAHLRTGLSRQARLPARAGVRQLLPSPSHPHGRRSRAQNIPARHRRRRTARTRRVARPARHRKPRSDVKAAVSVSLSLSDRPGATRRASHLRHGIPIALSCSARNL